MSWLDKIAPSILGKKKQSNFPTGVWLSCPECKEHLFEKELCKNLKVCIYCGHHFRLNAKERAQFLLDENSFELLDEELLSKDPLKFSDVKKYKDRMKNEPSKAKTNESIWCGIGTIARQKVSICIFNFFYMGGSMGVVAGEKIRRSIDRAYEYKIPLIIVSSSGGARMQEGTLSLLQMAKTSVALTRLKDSKIPYISILTDPTMGGVSASIAMLGDVILVEPDSLVGFAGPRVIQQTINQELPAGFQREEFLLQHGVVDRIVHRKDLRKEISLLLYYFSASVS
jgi:acetyl-CoA carboxylase carboxyl transferase subunit beta